MRPLPSLGTKSATENDATTRDFLKFFREENEKNRAALLADSEANRKLLSEAIKWISVPLTLLISVSAFLGWNSLDQVKKQGAVVLQQALDKENEKVQARMDEEFAKSSLQQTVDQRIQKSQFVQETINSALLHEKDDIDQKALKAVDEKTTLAVKKQIDLQRGEIEKLAQSMQGDLVRTYMQAARDHADARPKLQHPVDANADYTANSSLRVDATFLNEGRFPAKDINVFAVARLVPTPRGDNASRELFTNLANEIERQRSAGVKNIKNDVNFGQEMTLRATTISPVSSFDKDLLDKDNNELAFMFFFVYKASTGATFHTVYCGVAAGPDLKILAMPCTAIS